MQYYRNLGGNSGVFAFDIGSNTIKVQFKDGSIYLYNYSATGMSEVERLKDLALSGQGLNSYISKYIKKKYAAKIR